MRKPHVACAHGAHLGVGLFGAGAGGGYLGQFGLHEVRGSGHGGGARGGQQIVAVGKVAIGRVGRHPRAACGLAQHHSVGATLSGQLDTGVQQRAPQVAMAVGGARGGACAGSLGSAGGGGVAIGYGHGGLGCGHCPLSLLLFVDGVHNEVDTFFFMTLPGLHAMNGLVCKETP